MKKNVLILVAFALFGAMVINLSCNREDSNLTESDDAKIIRYGSKGIEGQYIIELNSAALPAELRSSSLPYAESQQMMQNLCAMVLTEAGVAAEKIERTYSSALYGFVATNLSKEDLKLLSSNKAIKLIEQDQMISLQGGPPRGGGGACANNNSETTPCGIPVVNGGSNYNGSKKAYVLDTGIDLTHPDLNVASYGFNAFTSGADAGAPNDLNGHGSHVAGTIAAKTGNGIGVRGVAAGALLVPVKVLDRNGSGSISGVIAGVDYVGANANTGDVANMSLGGGASTTLDNAVLNASNSNGGIWFIVAAGNNSANAGNYSPARVNGPYVRTIAAMTCSGSWASYSNFGAPPIDFIAPGSSICSTYSSGGYASLSGTSMACPHAAGVYLVTSGNPRTCGSVSRNGVTYPRICI
jgi:subtilisin family serine protease